MICGSVNEQTQRMNILIISGPYIDLDSTDPRFPQTACFSLAPLAKQSRIR